VDQALRMIADRNPKAKNRKAEEFIDASFMTEMETSGFLKSIWP
jgi:hypothetical protein